MLTETERRALITLIENDGAFEALRALLNIIELHAQADVFAESDYWRNRVALVCNAIRATLNACEV